MNMKKKIAIVGTNGLPSNYGGFETLVYYLSEYLSCDYDISVFCSSKGINNKIESYNNCKLVYIPLKANGAQSIPFDIISILKSYKRFDKVLILGSSGALVLPFLSGYRKKFIFNFGGLDWQRSKWGNLNKKFLRLSEKLGVKYSDYIIADNVGIQDYIKKTYNKKSDLITYGGDQVTKVIPNESDFIRYPFLKSQYAFSVARIQSDNNIDLLLSSFDTSSKFPFVMVGNWNNSHYGLETKKKFSNNPNLILLDAIYNQRELNLLRSNCEIYLHGHSAGGTNPALVEAMNLGLAIFAYDCDFNKYTTKSRAHYFKNSKDLICLLKAASKEELEQNKTDMLLIAKKEYQWEIIASKYSKIFNR